MEKECKNCGAMYALEQGYNAAREAIIEKLRELTK